MQPRYMQPRQVDQATGQTVYRWRATLVGGGIKIAWAPSLAEARAKVENHGLIVRSIRAAGSPLEDR